MIILFRESDDDESEEEDDDDCDYTEVTIHQLPINVRHVLNTIKDSKSLVKYVKRVFQLSLYT
jgi:hypothetical protein